LKAPIPLPCEHECPLCRVFGAGAGQDLAQAQLFIDDPMNDLSIFRRWCHHLQPVALAKPLTVKILLHREPRTE
jgi:hypothetical protein